MLVDAWLRGLEAGIYDFTSEDNDGYLGELQHADIAAQLLPWIRGEHGVEAGWAAAFIAGETQATGCTNLLMQVVTDRSREDPALARYALRGLARFLRGGALDEQQEPQVIDLLKRSMDLDENADSERQHARHRVGRPVERAFADVRADREAATASPAKSLRRLPVVSIGAVSLRSRKHRATAGHQLGHFVGLHGSVGHRGERHSDEAARALSERSRASGGAPVRTEWNPQYLLPRIYPRAAPRSPASNGTDIGICGGDHPSSRRRPSRS